MLVAVSRDEYRKPDVGMFKHVSCDIKVDMKRSFFVGDAAGRPAAMSRKKDHSNSGIFLYAWIIESVDLEFARGAGLKFYTPEQFFDVTDGDFTKILQIPTE